MISRNCFGVCSSDWALMVALSVCLSTEGVLLSCLIVICAFCDLMVLVIFLVVIWKLLSFVGFS